MAITRIIILLMLSIFSLSVCGQVQRLPDCTNITDFTIAISSSGTDNSTCLFSQNACKTYAYAMNLFIQNINCTLNTLRISSYLPDEETNPNNLNITLNSSFTFAYNIYILANGVFDCGTDSFVFSLINVPAHITFQGSFQITNAQSTYPIKYINDQYSEYGLKIQSVIMSSSSALTFYLSSISDVYISNQIVSSAEKNAFSQENPNIFFKLSNANLIIQNQISVEPLIMLQYITSTASPILFELNNATVNASISCSYTTSVFNGGCISIIDNANSEIYLTFYTGQSASGKGGILYAENFKKLQIDNSQFTQQSTSAVNGGGLYLNGSLGVSEFILMNSELKSLASTSDGGCIYAMNLNTFTVSNVSFNYCRSTGGGGGAIYMQNVNKTTINDTQFYDCTISELGSEIKCNVSDSIELSNIDIHSGTIYFPFCDFFSVKNSCNSNIFTDPSENCSTCDTTVTSYRAISCYCYENGTSSNEDDYDNNNPPSNEGSNGDDDDGILGFAELFFTIFSICVGLAVVVVLIVITIIILRKKFQTRNQYQNMYEGDNDDE